MLLGLLGGRGSGCLVLISLSSSPALFYAGTPSRGGFRGPGEQQAGELHPKAVGGRCPGVLPTAAGGHRGPQGAQGSIVLLETECRAPMT